MKRYSRSKGRKVKIFFIVLITFIIIELALLVFLKISPSPYFSSSIEKYALYVQDKCSSAPYRPACYDEEIPKLMDSISMEEAFEVTRIVQKEDPAYVYCHVLGHKLSARETAKNPLKWKEVITRCPTTMCNNGCLHGALMERFKSEYLSDEQIKSILPDLKDVCEPRGNWNPKEVERSMCYHALGHLHMYITSADIKKSVELCKIVGVKEDGRTYVQTCTEGVFMQIFQPLEPEDFALVKGITPKKEELESFCSSFTGESRSACWREGWPLFTKEVQTPEGITLFCSAAGDELSQRKCYGTVLNFITPLFVLDQGNMEKLKNFCIHLPQKRRNECFSNAASRLIQIDPLLTSKALDICRMAPGDGVSTCYQALIDSGTWSFHPGSNEFMRYCDKFPQPWDSKCKTFKAAGIYL